MDTMAFNVNALGFGDNVVDRYEHIHTMYPGGNAVNFAVYAKKCGCLLYTSYDAGLPGTSRGTRRVF